MITKVTTAAGRWSFESLEFRRLLSSWYVSASAGSDAGAGTLQSPLATIQKAATLARPGDTVFIRAGTYRETVTPQRSGTSSSPITYKPYNNERVVVSGADVVSGWSRRDGSIYRAPQPWDLGEGNNQVFVDGRMMIEARWPNTTLDVSHPRFANADSVAANPAGSESIATLRDAPLTQPAGTWAGAVIHFSPGQQWTAQTGRVTGASPGRIDFDYVQRAGLKSERMETPEASDPYYLTGKYVALDSAGEWFRDPSDGKLSLWAPGGDSPAGHVVEAKHRQYAFDLSGRSYVNVTGINVFAATLITDPSTSHVTLDHLGAQYLSHFTLDDTGWSPRREAGILLDGSDNVLSNSTLAYSAGNGVYVAGERNRVVNNVIHDVAYNGFNGLGINIVGYDHLIDGNTVYNCGRNGIMHAHLRRGRILHNVVHDVLLQATDGAGIYAWGIDGEGTEIAYNVVYNVHGGGFGGAGLYLDNGCSDHVIHHNLVYNADYGLKMNDPSHDNRVYNNTFATTRYSIAGGSKRDMLGSEFRNNIFTKPVQIGSAAVQSGNVTAGTDARFVDASAHDYQLRDDSPAIDRGAAIAPYTDGYAGARPDAGAFESGRVAWTAGAVSSAAGPDTTAPPAPAAPAAAAAAAGVSLDWRDSLARDRAAYDVDAAPSRTGPFTRLNASPLRTSEFLDAKAPAGAPRFYRIVVLDWSGNVSAPSAIASATRPRDVAPPAAAVSALTALAPTGGHVDLAWHALPDAASYRVQRMGPGDTSFVEIARGVVPSRFGVDGLRPGATYQFRIVGENSRGVSSRAATVRVTTPAIPAVPTKLAAQRITSTRIDVSFAPVSGAATYFVERSRGGTGPWVRIRTLAADVLSFSDANLRAGVRYAYRVQSAGPGGTSAFARTGSA